MRISFIDPGRTAIHATATATNAIGTPIASKRGACSSGKNLAAITTARIQAAAASTACKR